VGVLEGNVRIGQGVWVVGHKPNSRGESDKALYGKSGKIDSGKSLAHGVIKWCHGQIFLKTKRFGAKASR
jgi:hypothetical protein